MNDPIKLSNGVLQSLRPYAAMAGATEAFPGDLPAGFASAGVHPRDPQWNRYLGLTTSQPDQGTLVFGLSYDDFVGRATDEDIFVVDLPRQELRRYYRGVWESVDQRYRHTHRGDKDYLRFE